MATYEAQCSAVGSFGYANYFKLYVVLTEVNVNVANNTSQIQYNVYCQSSGSGSISAQHFKYFNMNDVEYINKTESVNVSSPNAYIPIASGTTGVITHNADGSKQVGFSAQIKASSYGVSASVSGVFTLTKIARYANITSFNVSNITGGDGLTKVKISWSADSTCDYIWYSINGGSTWNNLPTTNIISGLSVNTSYNFRIRIRRADSQLTTDSNIITKSTYDIAKISSLANFEHGNNCTVGITNPASISGLSLVMSASNTQILSRTVTAGNNTITFNDTELDNLYKKYGSSSSLTATFVLSGSGYTNSKTCTVTLKGNQKTIRTNVNSSWRPSKLWTNVNGTWKRGVLWTNVNGTWKRGI